MRGHVCLALSLGGTLTKLRPCPAPALRACVVTARLHSQEPRPSPSRPCQRMAQSRCRAVEVTHSHRWPRKQRDNTAGTQVTSALDTGPARSQDRVLGEAMHLQSIADGSSVAALCRIGRRWRLSSRRTKDIETTRPMPNELRGNPSDPRECLTVDTRRKLSPSPTLYTIYPTPCASSSAVRYTGHGEAARCAHPRRERIVPPCAQGEQATAPQHRNAGHQVMFLHRRHRQPTSSAGARPNSPLQMLEYRCARHRKRVRQGHDDQNLAPRVPRTDPTNLPQAGDQDVRLSKPQDARRITQPRTISPGSSRSCNKWPTPPTSARQKAGTSKRPREMGPLSPVGRARSNPTPADGARTRLPVR